MKVFDQQRSKALVWRKVTMCAIMVMCALGVAAIGYATDGFTAWPWTVRVGEDGKVRDRDGKVVGEMTEHEDGSSTVRIMTSPTTGLMGESPQSMKGEEIQIGAKPHPTQEP